jgi:hypothetical protein
VSKKRTAPAVFIERGAKKQRELLQAIIQEDDVVTASTSQTLTPESPTAPEPTATVDQQSGSIRYKRPGTKARATILATTTTTTTTVSAESKPILPPSLRDREVAHSNMDELAQVMDSWTIAEITKNLERMDDHATKSKYSPAKSRFRPKAPKQRYFERHPEHTAQQAAAAPPPPPPLPPGMDIDTGDTTDDEDYVLETYERVPVERLRDQAVPAHRVGLLVFDTEPDMVEFFYGNESDSEDEFPEDDEDENGGYLSSNVLT